MNTASSPVASASRRFVSIAAVAAALPLVPAAFGAALTWDGGGSDGLTSTAANWSTDVAPAATGDTLTFAGTTNLTVTNDSITSLGSGSITFASDAGSFNIGGNALTVGNTGANDNFITKISTADQTISANINLAGGQRDRTIIMTGGGRLTLSGNINFANDWLFPTTTAGTIVLSGNNTGDGKGAVLTSGTNTSRAMMRNNVAGTALVLGSDTALGNSGSGDIALGTAVFKGLVANQNMTISTLGGDRNLSGSTIIINTANVTFNGENRLTIGNILNQGGNRDFAVTGAGGVTVANAITTSNDQTARALYNNVTGGDMIVNGKLYDTFHSGGVTATVNDSTGTATNGIFRKAGSGTMILNGDSGATYTGTIQIDAGTLRIGHANALGSTAGATIVIGGATLDLNGQTTGETLKINSGTGVGGNGALVNSNTSVAATLTADIVNPGSFTVGGAGDINATRIRSSGVFTITKVGSGTLTTGGSDHNNLAAWNIQSGTVVFANTSGFAADRGVTLTGGTLRLSGANTDLINNDQAFVIGGGTFELNGNSETIGAVTLNDATTSTIDFGSGASTFLVSSISGTGLLNVLNWTEGVDSFRVTADASSVLGQITINGLSASIANMGAYYEISAAAIPEPSSAAALAGLGVLGAVALRRRRR